MRKIQFSDLEFGDALGSGGFGTVYTGFWKSRNKTVAIKKVAGLIRPEEVYIGNLATSRF